MPPVPYAVTQPLLRQTLLDRIAAAERRMPPMVYAPQ
jgi:hypothetical protein